MRDDGNGVLGYVGRWNKSAVLKNPLVDSNCRGDIVTVVVGEEL